MTTVGTEATSSAGDAAPVAERLAGAPISWGVCEVPGWGYQLAPEVVLRQMRELGLAATEFGPAGFLPVDPRAKAAVLAEYGLAAVGQFVPVVLHHPTHDPLRDVEGAIAGLVAARASTIVIAAATGRDGYDDRPVLDRSGWATLLRNLDRITEAATAYGLVATLHPHVGTMVESGQETERVLADSRIGLCLDTGHLLIGGGDPVAIGQQHPGRIAHTHLKDVRLDWARRVQSSEVTYTEAVAGGMYVPLGRGDVDIQAIVAALEGNGYAGWYVLEQDTILSTPPVAGATGGPVADMRMSIAHLRAVSAAGSVVTGGRTDAGR